MDIKIVDINDIHLNKKNPRTIKDDKFKKLVKSIKTFPKMLEIRPIVVDSDMIILGGNMRYKACVEAGLKQVPIICVDKLSEEQKNEFIIKDNVGYGEWDWEILNVDWEKEKLSDWGLDIPKWAGGLDLDKKVNVDNIISLFINLKDEEDQKYLYNKLIELGYSQNDIKLMSFSSNIKKDLPCVDESNISTIGGVMKFKIERINEPKLTFNVKYVLDKFDMSAYNKQSFEGEIDLNFDWNVGLIVGNSGTGKSTIAKELFGDYYKDEYIYNDGAIIDNFGNNDINVVIDTLTSVGLSSTTTWLKPYHVLSGGEKMRCDLARAILSENEVIIFDEFTSVVDRQIAKIGSFVTQKNIRKSNKKFIAVGCHFDVEDWLMPDWIFNTNDMSFVVNKKKSEDQMLDLKLENAQIKLKKRKHGKFLQSIII